MAGRPCTICSHPKKGAIEVDLMTGGSPENSQRAIAGRYGVQKSSLQRHRDKCMGERAEVADQVRANVMTRANQAMLETVDHGAAQARSVLARVEDLMGPVLDAVRDASAIAAKPGAEPELVLRALDTIGKLTNVAHTGLRTIGQASGEIPTGAAQVNVLVVKEAERIRGDEWRYQDAMVAAAIDAMARRVPADEVSAAREEAAEAAWQARCRLGGGDVVDVEGEVVQ